VPTMKVSLILFFMVFWFLEFANGENHTSLQKNAEPPNLVFIIADDCTFRDIGCYGGQAFTPHIDHLATEGMKFSSCFQAAPMCSPTRHNIYTGLYPVKSGAYPNHTRAFEHVKSIAHYLQPVGYRVVQTGKKHFNPPSVFPFEYFPKSKGRDPDMGSIDELFTQCKTNNTPFCLFACSNSPHSPWTKGDASRYPPEDIKLPPYIVDTPVLRKHFSDYLAEITHFDSEVGSILNLLKKHQLEQDTLVMVVSEQGNSFPFAKWTCYDSGLQSAMVVRWPGRIQAGVVSDALVEYVDVCPTFVDLAGEKEVDGLDGKSFLPVLMGESKTHKEFVYGIMTTRGIINGSDAYAIRSVRNGNYKLIKNLNFDSKFTNACSKSDYFKSMVNKANEGDPKAKRFVNAYHYRPAIEFFDIQSDPLELNNLASDPAYQLEITRLSEQLENWMSAQGDQGVVTELKAHERQAPKRKKNKK
jgi:N-sulfoglucosamine sulfohydrolase